MQTCITVEQKNPPDFDLDISVYDAVVVVVAAAAAGAVAGGGGLQVMFH
jgi:hypothetical protein